MDAAQILLECLRTELNARPEPPPDSKIMLRAGGEVTPLLGTGTDECCTGLAWVRIASSVPNPDILDLMQAGCFATERVVTLEMGVVRCAPSSDISGVPTADQWTATALQLDSDHEAMEAALCCSYGPLRDLGNAPPVASEYTPFGVDGNCIGATMTVTLEVNCGCTA
jgi:hypothetical protein